MAKRIGKKLDEDGGGTAVADRPKKGKKQKMLNDDPAFEHIKEIESLALEYVDLRDRRQAIGADEVEVKGRLIETLKKHDLETYSFDGYMVCIEHEEETVKVKKKRAAKEDGGIA